MNKGIDIEKFRGSWSLGYQNIIPKLDFLTVCSWEITDLK